MNSASNYLAPAQLTDPTQGVKNAAQIKKASKDFEAMFVSEMLRPVFDTQKVNPLFGGGNSEQIYRSMMVDEYGKAITKSGGIGIAKHVEAELLKLQEAKKTNDNTQESPNVTR